MSFDLSSLVSGEYAAGGSRLRISTPIAGEYAAGGSRLRISTPKGGEWPENTLGATTASATSAADVHMDANGSANSSVTASSVGLCGLELFPSLDAAVSAATDALAQFARYYSENSTAAAATETTCIIGILGLADSSASAVTEYGHTTTKPVSGNSAVTASGSGDVSASFGLSGNSNAALASGVAVRCFLSDVADSGLLAAAGASAQMILHLETGSEFSASTGAVISKAFWEIADSAGVLTANASRYVLVIATAESAAALASGATGGAVFFLTAQSLAELVTGTLFVADFTDGWSYNLNTGAASFYEDFAFNSFAQINGRYYGASEDGIYLLGANDDAGAEIKATITLGKSRLGSPTQKRVDTVYAGAKSDNPLLLTCRVEGKEYSYEFTAAAKEMTTCRAKPGKGLSGVYWTLELANQAGADFELDSLEILTTPTSRRV